jgi:ribosomal protein S18 acetylase RimI-like enzyme
MVDVSALRRLREDEIPELTAMLTRAFAHDPLAAILAADPAQYETAAHWFFGTVVRYGMAYGEVWTVGERAGAAIWWAPEYAYPNDERAVEVGIGRGPSVLGADGWRRFMSWAMSADRVHRAAISGPHWHLSVLGVEPDLHGTGVGSTLLSAMFERLDREQLPAYLDTETLKNVAFYERRGFVVAAEETEPLSGMHIRGMRRDPR